MNNPVAFVGGGSFGTALAIHLSKKGIVTKIWDRNDVTVTNINTLRENLKYLPKVKIAENISASTSLEETLKNCKFVVLSVPSFAIRDICRKVEPYIYDDTVIISIAKGIETESGKRLSEVIEEELPNNTSVILSGPSHAEEVAVDIPTVVAVTSKNMEKARIVQDLFMTNKFRVYTNEDIIGIEIGGAVKNIIALAAGISDGIGYGDNTKAALMTRGMSEILRIGESLGGKKETFSGLTGMGDLIVTCTSLHSRNRRAGILIGEGYTPEEACKKVGMVVEGITACDAFYTLKEKRNIYMPITDILYKVLFKGLDPAKAVNELMSKGKKSEI
jgi:glycerol-3-phosphate dehydrogenase (NAD(P)+)